MASRRCASIAPRPRASGGDCQKPSPSGPRCACARFIRWSAAALISSSRPMIPAMPHMAVSPLPAAFKAQSAPEVDSYSLKRINSGLRSGASWLKLAAPRDARTPEHPLRIADAAQPAPIRRAGAHARPLPNLARRHEVAIADRRGFDADACGRAVEYCREATAPNPGGATVIKRALQLRSSPCAASAPPSLGSGLRSCSIARSRQRRRGRRGFLSSRYRLRTGPGSAAAGAVIDAHEIEYDMVASSPGAGLVSASPAGTGGSSAARPPCSFRRRTTCSAADEERVLAGSRARGR